MSINDKISIIIPVYNLENYIERTLDSVCAQTYKKIEVIVVDDGSTDKSFDIISNFSEKDNRVIPVHKENGGVTSARLKGLEIATGEWIGFVDGDDLIDEDMYEFLLNNAKEYNADISHCGYKMVFPNGRTDYYYNTNRLVEQDNYSGLYDLLKGEFVEPGLCNKIFRKTIIQRFLTSNTMNTELKYLEDLLMNYYLFKLSNKSVYEDKCKYSYVLRNGSAATSSFNMNKYYHPQIVFETIIDDTDEAELKFIALLRLVGFLIGNTVSNDKQISKESIMKLKDYKYILKDNNVSKKIKTMFIMSVYFNSVYSLVRKIYEKYSGVGEKYSLEN